MAYLEGKNLVASYGVVPILHECSVEVEKGELAISFEEMYSTSKLTFAILRSLKTGELQKI